MKTLLFTMISFAMLISDVSYAGPSAPASTPPPPVSANLQNKQTSATPASPQAQNNQQGQGETQTGNNYVNTPPPNPSPSAINPPQSGSRKTVSAANAVLPANKTTRPNNLTTRPSNVIQSAGPMFKDARNREPVVTVIGGPAKSKTTAVINGTAMNHKPL